MRVSDSGTRPPPTPRGETRPPGGAAPTRGFHRAPSFVPLLSLLLWILPPHSLPGQSGFSVPGVFPEPPAEASMEAGHPKAPPVSIGSAASPTPYRKVGLALSGGGARGFAHVGVLKVLEEIGMPIDFIAGTSMGSIVGGLRAVGYRAADLEKTIRDIDWDGVFSDSPPRQSLSFQEKAASVSYFFQLGFNRRGPVVSPGLTSGQKALHLLYLLTLRYAENIDFDLLPIPYRAVATDLQTGETVILGEGSLAAAMRASMGVPGLFTPLELGGRLLVDGGVSANLPVQAVKDMGADIVIAVDLNSLSSIPKNMERPDEVLDQVLTIMIDQSQRPQRELADLVVKPDIRDHSPAAFAEHREIIRRGEEAARALLPELRRLAELAWEGRPPAGDATAEASPEEILVETVEILGAKQDDELSVRNRLSTLLGRPIGLAAIHDLVTGIYTTGRYETLRYELAPGNTGDGKKLLIRLRPRKDVNNLLRLGFSYDSFARVPSVLEDPLNDRFTLKLNLTIRDLTGPGSLWSTDLSHISGSEVSSELIQPLWGPLFISPSFHISNSERLMYTGESLNDDLKTFRVHGQIRLGTFLSRFGQVYGGYRLEGVRSAPLFGEGFDSFEGRLAYLLFGARRDTLDRFPFPRSGTFGKVDYLRAAAALGGDHDFHQFSADFRFFMPLGTRHVLEIALFGGTFFDTAAFDWNRWYLGGRSRFPGFPPGALAGNQSAIFGLHYRFQVPGLRGLPRDRLHVCARAAAGNAWDEPLEDLIRTPPGLRYGGSLGIGIDSPIGAILLDLGVKDSRGAIIYFSIGNQL